MSDVKTWELFRERGIAPFLTGFQLALGRLIRNTAYLGKSIPTRFQTDLKALTTRTCKRESTVCLLRTKWRKLILFGLESTRKLDRKFVIANEIFFEFFSERSPRNFIKINADVNPGEWLSSKMKLLKI